GFLSMISICILTVLFALTVIILLGVERRRKHLSAGVLVTAVILEVLTILLNLFQIYGLA
ncbi:MAG: hypothetical protein IKM31_08285, partial [Oscillospiraceae bacterium]|nr:hypothetical protein [Oscillospiraceae bacterium]